MMYSQHVNHRTTSAARPVVAAAVSLSKRIFWWMRRILLGLVVLVIMLLVAGWLYQNRAEARDRRNFPPPGQLVDVGDYRLHVQVMGNAGNLPTVILEHGSSSMSTQWAWIQPKVAQFTRVVAYDRPGQGWSDPSPRQLSAPDLARDLHPALTQLGIAGPYVLVGHSMGSLPARTFAEQYEAEVVGMVLVDPRNLALADDFPQLPPIEPSEPPAGVRLAPIVAAFGLIRLLDPIGSYVDQLPPQNAAEARSILAGAKMWHGLWPDVVLAESAVPILRDGEQLSSKPLMIVSAGKPDAMDFPPADRAAFTTMHAQMADALSARGEHKVVAEADHLSLVTRLEHATVVADAIRQVVDTASAFR